MEENIALMLTVELLQNGSISETFMHSWAEEVKKVRSAVQRVWSGAKERGDGEQSSLACNEP